MSLLPSVTDNSAQDNLASIQATYAGAKRRIATLEQQLKISREERTKQKSDINPQVTQGRAICRLVSLFEPVEALVDESDRRQQLAACDGDEEGQEGAVPTLEQEHVYRGYQLMVQHIAGIEEKLLEPDITQLGVYFRNLRKGAGGARGDDAANLKPAIISWIGPLFEGVYEPLCPTNKSDRGFQHELTGRLLCPVDYKWSNPEVQQNICDGHPDFVVTGDAWPAFLYPNAECDPDDVEKGLFKSALLLKAFKFILTSPTSALDIETKKDLDEPSLRPSKRSRRQRAPTRGHVANLIGMKTVSPRSIAYVAVQLRFSLSNASAWHEDDGCFNYALFYNNIVDFFELTPGPASQRRTRDLLTWWSSKVFGNHTLSSSARFKANSSVSKLAAQRAARELAAQGLLSMSQQ